MELLQGGELFDRIIDRKFGYPEPEACRLITIILEAVEHLHERGVVHRDIKPENFLFDDSTDTSMLKLIDFGFATFKNPNGLMIGSSCGTPDYIAPELLLERPHTESVDLWSVGVVLYILLCGFPPFYAETDDELFNLISQGNYDFPSPQWDTISRDGEP
jgi:serine/threonine protein kinase